MCIGSIWLMRWTRIAGKVTPCGKMTEKMR